jgi:hypothetical protein
LTTHQRPCILHVGELGCVMRFRRQGVVIAKGTADPLLTWRPPAREIRQVAARPMFSVSDVLEDVPSSRRANTKRAMRDVCCMEPRIFVARSVIYLFRRSLQLSMTSMFEFLVLPDSSRSPSWGLLRGKCAKILLTRYPGAACPWRQRRPHSISLPPPWKLP